MLKKKVVVQDIQSNARELAALPGEQPFAGQDIRMLVGVTVYRQMMANAQPHGIRQCSQIQAPGKIAQKATDSRFGRVRGKKQMGKMIQRCVPGLVNLFAMSY